ncbi:phospholipid phosphatase homolog 1.2 homolog isoform X1 [Pieris napi]|uniref:phospholipid phosphatase homolog 1.2 homolog isoform X1 n=1 Tax=Pieris napi TaxID=78633 RepID=UPI001FBB55AC|nr:phospholipid phosphatase homolog 1.2 homolog isoform X1 [Pieris napi]
MDIYKKVFKISKLLWSKINRWHRAFFIFFVAELNLVPGGQVGFQCNDPALSHPYTGDTVNWKWLFGTTILLPLVVLLITERQQCNHEIAKKQAFCWFKEYLYGFLLNLTIVQALKLIVGSPRPHFFETCEPNEALTCEESEYVSSYTCTTANWLKQSNKSFPSGHTSLAVHAAVFITYYLYRRGRKLNSKIVSTVQIVSLSSAALCSLSRIWDRRHHWWDVIAGAVIALLLLVYTISTLCNNFNCSSPKSQVNKEQDMLVKNETETS